MSAPSMRLIVPHFGKRPSCFPVAIKSMAHNPDVHWLIFTDAPVPDAPSNVAVELWEFAQFAKRIQDNFEFEISLDRPYKLCDFRPAFGEIFRDELAGYDFWGHTDLDVVFGQIRDHLPPEAFKADKILFQGNFALYRNTAEVAQWYRHEVGKVSYRKAMTTSEAMHFDEWAGIFYVVADLGVPFWHEECIFDLSFMSYRTRAESPPGNDPRRYAWERGEVCEYRWGGGRVVRRTALLVHFQKRTMRPPSTAVLAADRFWIESNGFRVQKRVTAPAVLAAWVPRGREIVSFNVRKLQRIVRRRAARKAARQDAC